MAGNFTQGGVGGLVHHTLEFACGVVELAGVHCHLGHEQAAVLGIGCAGELALELAGQLRHLGGVGLASRGQRGFQQRLVEVRSPLRLVTLMLLPGLPAEHNHQRQQATGQQGLAVTLPPILYSRELLFFGTRHPNTPIR
ncbi:hypothetical protein D3C85_1186980 [compost metagenome]